MRRMDLMCSIVAGGLEAASTTELAIGGWAFVSARIACMEQHSSVAKSLEYAAMEDEGLSQFGRSRHKPFKLLSVVEQRRWYAI
jgi:hypothetical protein